MRVKDELAYRLRRAIEAKKLDLFIGTGGSVALSDVDQPRPDIIVMRRLEGEKAVELEWVVLLVEVSSSTFSFDAGAKAAMYARHGVPEHWIADVNARMIHQMWMPEVDGYCERREVTFGKHLTSTAIIDLIVKTEAL